MRELFARISAPESAPPWSLTSVLLTLAFAVVAMIVGSGAVLVWVGEQAYTQLAGWTLGGILIAIFVWQTRRSDREALRLTAAPTPILFVMFIALGGAIALDLLSLAVTREFLPKPELIGPSLGVISLSEWVFVLLFAVLVQPIAEGLVFRGVALPALRVALGTWSGIVITAILSGGFHYLIYPPNYATAAALTPIWYGLIAPALEAVVFCAVRAYTGSTRAAIAAQIAFGVFAVVKLLALVG